MEHDFSHLDEAVGMVLLSAAEDRTRTPHWTSVSSLCRMAAISAITPSDLAALLAEKCPHWVAVPRFLTNKMERAWNDCDHEETACGDWGAFLSAAPKLGDEQ